MSKKDWQQLQAYRATGLTPDETDRAVRVLSGYLEGAICYDQIRDGAGCPGKEKCPLGAALFAARAAKPDSAITAENGTVTACEDLAIFYPAAVLRYFWSEAEKRERSTTDEK